MVISTADQVSKVCIKVLTLVQNQNTLHHGQYPMILIGPYRNDDFNSIPNSGSLIMCYNKKNGVNNHKNCSSAREMTIRSPGAACKVLANRDRQSPHHASGRARVWAVQDWKHPLRLKIDQCRLM